LSEVINLLHDARVVTLAGVGGVGKTRLALQVVAEMITRYHDGAWLVELAPIVDPGAVIEVAATTLGVTQRQGQSVTQSVVDFLRAKNLILVIDNCEHLLDAAAQFIDEVVHSCPKVSIIATSREGLGVAGERMFPVPSLELPPDEDRYDVGSEALTEATRLFEERANEARAGFVITEDNRRSIVRLCRRLDGIPLAIELAAARMRSLTPAEIADHLDARFRLLAGGPRTAVERHQTLRRAIDWSYDLLSEAEQMLLNRLAVFAGSFTVDAAEFVMADDAIDRFEVIDLLGHLVDKSLLGSEPTGEVSRYRLLETIRQYAEERLEETGAADVCRQRHAEYYASFASAAGSGLSGCHEVIWTTRVESELDNLRAAVAWAQSMGDVHLAMRLVAPLALNGTRIGYATGPWAQPILALPGASQDPLFRVVQAWAGWSAVTSGENELGVRLVREAADAVQGTDGEDKSMCRVLGSATGALGATAHNDEIGPLANRWAAAARSLADEYELAMALIMVGLPFAFAGDLPAALVYLDQAVETARRLGNPTAICYTTMTAGWLRSEAEPEEAMALLDEALEQAVSVGNNLGIGMVLSSSAQLHETHGRSEEAVRLIVMGAEHFHRIGDLNQFGTLLHAALVVLAMAHADESAAVLYGATPLAKGVYKSGEVPNQWEERFREVAGSLRSRLGEDRFNILAVRGSRMDNDQLVSLLRAEASRILSALPP
jgi:predicted ATPase